MKLTAYFSSFLLILIALGSIRASFGWHSTDQAYVTLLYGDEFLLGVRVLGKSIRNAGSSKDMVVLVSDGVSGYDKKLLQMSGRWRDKFYWRMRIKSVRKVVHLDADTILVKNIEDLFRCGKYCANLKHSERLNSGVMVFEPSEPVFNDTMSKVNTLHSYTGGDQGFLNSYYPDFLNAHVFEPNLSREVLKSRPVPDLERLSTLYNADVGLYMIANEWMVNETELRVIHYTLGPLKPWDWWTSSLLRPVDDWQDVRIRLEETLPRTGGGRNPNDDVLVKVLFLLLLCALFFCYYRSFLQMQEHFGSLCDQIRLLYFKIRSCAAMA